MGFWPGIVKSFNILEEFSQFSRFRGFMEKKKEEAQKRASFNYETSNCLIIGAEKNAKRKDPRIEGLSLDPFF